MNDAQSARVAKDWSDLAGENVTVENIKGTYTMTDQEKLEAKLAQAGIPAKEIKCSGSLIIITTRGEDSARKWAALLAKFATVRAVVKSRDESVIQKGTCLKRTYHKVWRVGAYI